MIKTKSIIGALLVSILFAAAPAAAQEGHATPEIHKEAWSFAGPFGTYDRNQLQRGFQVFKEVCSSCHSARLMAFRNLGEKGGPEFTEGQVKALAAEYEINDPDAEGGKRPGIAADRWPSPFANDQEARDANGGALPPDFSVLAKARGTTQPFPWWILNYFTAYSEGGPDYIHALLNGYVDPPPHGAEVPEGKHYNTYFPGHALGMAPPLSDGAVTYEEGETGSVPLTVDQYSRDVASFMMWMAEPHLVARKEAGFQVIAFLLVFAGLMYLVKRKLWSRVEH
ncbi:cytochrome C [Devosia insulae DS-56]|uniref:Cytochrome c1 n=1 Tax=Devosia insulae DS-56 TaxID=1116389 RepID=A0A1E5XIB4_9HYPH|nr:cytochrome c1 [Devosia insulae]OEO28339.1 cytochrome C [Devosia insulae DS-56]